MLEVDKLADVAALRDALVTAKDGAIKYTPLIQDKLNALNLPPSTKALPADVLAAMAAQVQSESEQYHDTAIANLKLELADPRYAGKTTDEIVDLLNAEVIVIDEQSAPTGILEAIKTVMADFAVVPLTLGIFKDGTVIGDEGDKVKDRIQAALAAQTPTTVQVEVGRLPAPITKAYQGIPYARNLARSQEVVEASK